LVYSASSFKALRILRHRLWLQIFEMLNITDFLVCLIDSADESYIHRRLHRPNDIGFRPSVLALAPNSTTTGSCRKR